MSTDPTNHPVPGEGFAPEPFPTPSEPPQPPAATPPSHAEPPLPPGVEDLTAQAQQEDEAARRAEFTLVEGEEPVQAGEVQFPGPSVPGLDHTAKLSPRHQLESWLQTMVELDASDLILRAGGRPSCRVDGRIRFLEGKVPGAGPLREVLEGIVGPDNMDTWKTHGSVDVALALDGLGRFRLNAYKQMGEPALVLRRVHDQPPKLEELFLPDAELRRLAQRKRGLILVTGVAGSGKSTTLAGMIDYMNRHTERHIVTLEDPIEIIFNEERCVISQREVGTDCDTFHEGLRHSLRQSPDAILIGEMRDAETVAAALDAVETGHLILSTLHTVNSAQTVDRILGFFDADRHAQICTRLADNLAGVLSQRLLPRSSGQGLVPACELLTSTPRVRELLEKGQTVDLARAVESGVEPGLLSFNQSLKGLVEQNLVELEVALAASDRPDELMLGLRGYQTGANKSRLRLSGNG